MQECGRLSVGSCSRSKTAQLQPTIPPAFPALLVPSSRLCTVSRIQGSGQSPLGAQMAALSSRTVFGRLSQHSWQQVQMALISMQTISSSTSHATPGALTGCGSCHQASPVADVQGALSLCSWSPPVHCACLCTGVNQGVVKYLSFHCPANGSAQQWTYPPMGYEYTPDPDPKDPDQMRRITGNDAVPQLCNASTPGDKGLGSRMVGLLVSVAPDLLADGKQVVTLLSPLCASVLAPSPEADITATGSIELPQGMIHVLQWLGASACHSSASRAPACLCAHRLPAWCSNTGAALLASVGEATLYQNYSPNATAAAPVALLCPSGSWAVGVVGNTDPDDLYLQRM
jgi:hypothetical protein